MSVAKQGKPANVNALKVPNIGQSKVAGPGEM